MFTFADSVTFLSTSTCFAILGLKVGSVYSGITITCPYPLNLLGIKTIAVRSTQLMTNNYSSTRRGVDNLLSVIQVNASSFGLIQYQAQGELNYHLLLNNLIHKIDLQLHKRSVKKPMLRLLLKHKRSVKKPLLLNGQQKLSAID